MDIDIRVTNSSNDDEIQYLFQKPHEATLGSPSPKRQRSEELLNLLDVPKAFSKPDLDSKSPLGSPNRTATKGNTPTNTQRQNLTLNLTDGIGFVATLSTPLASKPRNPSQAPYSTPKAPRSISTPQAGTFAPLTTPDTPSPKRRKHQWSKKIYLDMALTLQASFSFTGFAAKHGLEETEVFDAFSAIVLSPLLEQGTKGKDMVRVFRGEERELIGRLKEVAKSMRKQETVEEPSQGFEGDDIGDNDVKKGNDVEVEKAVGVLEKKDA